MNHEARQINQQRLLGVICAIEILGNTVERIEEDVEEGLGSN